MTTSHTCSTAHLRSVQDLSGQITCSLELLDHDIPSACHDVVGGVLGRIAWGQDGEEVLSAPLVGGVPHVLVVAQLWIELHVLHDHRILPVPLGEDAEAVVKNDRRSHVGVAETGVAAQQCAVDSAQIPGDVLVDAAFLGRERRRTLLWRSVERPSRRGGRSISHRTPTHTFLFGTNSRIVSVTRRPLRERTVSSSTFRRFSSSRMSKFYRKWSREWSTWGRRV